MLFTSFRYLIFLTITVVLYYVVPVRMRLPLLLFASLYFYAVWDPFSLVWLLMIIVISYLAGIILSQTQDEQKKKQIAALSSGSMLLVLIAFKYKDVLITRILNIADAHGLMPASYASDSKRLLAAAVPVGLSFFTFQALGYIFDVARGKTKASWDFGKYALFIAFFPHIMQGPIDRADNLLPQMDEVHTFDYEGYNHGLAMILFGAFKKVVIANRLAVLVDTVYEKVGGYSGQAYWVAAVFFAFQIYCDFSGYTDMALGSAELMGFRLPVNFKRPFLATSVSDFWRRWHISLSNWFRDYLYFPLGGSHVSEARWAFNVMVVFLVSGLWHGTSWTFLLWGFLNGLCQVVGKYKNRLLAGVFGDGYGDRSRIIHCLRVAVTFLIVVLLLIPFRANSLGDLKVILKGFFRPMPDFSIYHLGAGRQDVNFSILLIFIVIVTDVIGETVGGYALLQKMPVLVRRVFYMACVFVILLFGVYGSLTSDSFIYFRF